MKSTIFDMRNYQTITRLLNWSLLYPQRDFKITCNSVGKSTRII